MTQLSPGQFSLDISRDRGRPDAATAQRGRLPRLTSYMLLLPIFALMIGIFYLPIGIFFLKSFTVPTLTLEHYRRIVEEPLYLQVILRTFRVAASTTALALVLGYPVAILLHRAKGWSSVIVMACVLIPLWTSVLVRSYAWIILMQRMGIINTTLRELGIIEQPITMLYTEYAVLVAMAHVLLPFMILPIYSTLRGIPDDLVKAALNLGASRSRAFFSVTLPLSLPGIFAGCLIVFVLALGFYITPIMVGGPRTLMIATLISQQAMDFLDWPFASAISVTLLVLSAGAMAVFGKVLGIRKASSHG